MKILEVINLVSIITLCIFCSKSDLNIGLIKNKILGVFAIIAVGSDSIYYGYFARDLLAEFLVNIAVVSAVSLFLFYSHSFAGGDCKMTIVLSLLYPARFYVVYDSKNSTLIFAVGLAIFVGFVYLTGNAILTIVTKKSSVTWKSTRTYFLNFLKSYLVATVYITFINLVFAGLGIFGITIDMWISVVCCMALAWCIGRFQQFKNTIAVVCVAIAVVLLSIVLRVFPISLNPQNYVLMLILLLCQIAIRSTMYETIAVSQLKKGMILSTMSTMLMQSSITKGLPKLSTEDLKSRLTESEINSVLIWAKATRTDTLTVVKKIPFAIFISIGFVGYFVLWCIL